MLDVNAAVWLMGSVKPHDKLRKSSTIKLVLYLTSITLGMVLILIGISWLCLLGCAITLSALLFSGNLRIHPFRVRLVSYLGLVISLFGGVWQFVQAERYGFVFLRVPPHWWFVVFIIVAWLSLFVRELRPGRSRW